MSGVFLRLILALALVLSSPPAFAQMDAATGVPEMLAPVETADPGVSEQLQEVKELQKKLSGVTEELQQEQQRMERLVKDAQRERRNRALMIGLISSAVIISGILLWRRGRAKKD